MKITGIYRIQSKIKPERIYVGSVVNVQKRWNEHRNSLVRHAHCNKKLQNHYNKYGLDDLQFSLIVGCGEDTLMAFEQFYIDALNPWFNICPIAGSTRGIPREYSGNNTTWNKGKTLSEEHKQRISNSMTGDKNPMYGRPAPIKGTRGKYPNKWKGIKGRYSEEALAKRSLGNKKAWEKRKQKQKEELCHQE
jgi:group I intron endonuclease